LKLVFERHEHGPRMLSKERVRSLSCGASRGRDLSLSRAQRSLSRSKVPTFGPDVTTIMMPEIAEHELEDTSLRDGGRDAQSSVRERSLQKVAHEQLRDGDENPHVLRGPWEELDGGNLNAFVAAPASRRGRSLPRRRNGEEREEDEPWWVGVARRPRVPEEQLRSFVDQWKLERGTVDMLRNLQPGLLYYVIRDFAPPANLAGVSRFGYDGVLNKFVRNAEWKLKEETRKMLNSRWEDVDPQPWRRPSESWR